MNTEEEHSGA